MALWSSQSSHWRPHPNAVQPPESTDGVLRKENHGKLVQRTTVVHHSLTPQPLFRDHALVSC